MLSSSHLGGLASPFPYQYQYQYHRGKAPAIRAESSIPAPPAGKSAAARKRRSAAKGGDAAEAAAVVRQLLRRTGGGKETIVSVLNKNVKVIRKDHCFLLFEELGKKEGWLQCLEVFRWMQMQRWYVADNGIFSKLISVMGKKGQVRMAMWLFSQMRNSGCRPDTSVYNSLITAHLHSRDKIKALAKARGYFEKMKTIERCQPNLVTYNILLRAFAQASDVQQVEALFKDLDESTLKPDVYTYNGVLDAYGKNGMLREMEAILVCMKNNRIKPDVITFNTLIDAYGKKQAFDKMEQVFKSLLRSKESPTLPTFHCMITNYGKARLREKAELVVEKMADLGYKPSYITRECLIMMYGYCGNVSKARIAFDEILTNGQWDIQVSSLNAMLDAYCKNGVPSEAFGLLNDVITKGFVVPNSSTYKLLYKAFTKAGRKDLIDGLLKLMDKQGIVPNKKFFLEALEAYGSAPSSSPGSSESPVIRKSGGVNDSSSQVQRKSRNVKDSSSSQVRRKFSNVKDNSSKVAPKSSIAKDDSSRKPRPSLNWGWG